jgi:hypothetical protein
MSKGFEIRENGPTPLKGFSELDLTQVEDFEPTIVLKGLKQKLRLDVVEELDGSDQVVPLPGNWGKESTKSP